MTIKQLKILPSWRRLAVGGCLAAVLTVLIFVFVYAPALVWLFVIKGALADYHKNQFKRAEETLSQGLKIARSIPGDRSSLLEPLSLLADVYLAEGRAAEARVTAEEMVAIISADAGRQSMTLIPALNCLAHSYRIQARYKDAESYYRQALAIADAHHQTSKSLATVLSQLSKLYVYEGRFPEAKQITDKLAKVYDENFSAEDIVRADLFADESDLEEAAGHYASAERLATKALDWRQARAGAMSMETAKSLVQLSSLLVNQAELERAWKPALAAKQIIDAGQAQGYEANTKILALTNLALLQTWRHDLKEAEANALGARDEALSVLSSHHPYCSNALVVLAMIKHRQGHFPEAIALLLEAQKNYEEALGPNNRLIARALAELAAIYLDQGEYEKAESSYKQAMKVSSNFFGGPHPSAAGILRGYADLLDKEGKTADSKRFRAEATKILQNAQKA